MNDEEIRALIRTTIEKHLGGPPVAVEAVVVSSRPATSNLSFGRYLLPRAEDDVMCLIEPAVRCNHCGYCQCHGH